MELRIDIELQGSLLLVNASGEVALEAALRLLKQSFDTAKEKNVSKILVNTLAVEGELSTFDRYRLATGAATHLRQRELNPRIAFVGKPPTSNGFGVRVAQNRDVVAEMFSSQQEAMDWLNSWPS